MRNQHKAAIIALALASGLPHLVWGDTVNYWGYPAGGAPGGSTFSHVSGTRTIDAGGSTNQYGGFNPAAYNNLYWVVDTVAGAPILGTSPTDTLAFDAGKSNPSGGVLAFDGSYTVSTAFGSQSYFGELLVTVTNTSLSPLSLDAPASHTGIPAADGGALHVTGPYDVNLQFLMAANSSAPLQAASTYFNNLHAGGGLIDSVSGGFYVAPVPLPAAAFLFLSGLGGLGVFGIRKRGL
jgi:hypothetical protein